MLSTVHECSQGYISEAFKPISTQLLWTYYMVEVDDEAHYQNTQPRYVRIMNVPRVISQRRLGRFQPNCFGYVICLKKMMKSNTIRINHAMYGS